LRAHHNGMFQQRQRFIDTNYFENYNFANMTSVI